MMTVDQLILQLQQMPWNADVALTDDGEGSAVIGVSLHPNGTVEIVSEHD